jgi:hypothetical protein
MLEKKGKEGPLFINFHIIVRIMVIRGRGGLDLAVLVLLLVISVARYFSICVRVGSSLLKKQNGNKGYRNASLTQIFSLFLSLLRIYFFVILFYPDSNLKFHKLLQITINVKSTGFLITFIPFIIWTTACKVSYKHIQAFVI